MFGQHHDISEQNDQNVAPTGAVDDSMLSSLPMPGDLTTNDAVQSSDTTAMPQSFRQTTPAPATTPPAGSLSSSATLTSNTGTDDLIGIKQQALQQLKPLVGHLEQSPEEKFRTTMMMIQAADDQTLINEAYAAAKSIADDKTRAQALLDVVNEINYFTAQSTQA